MESSSSHQEGGLSKWQIAALIGVPVAAVAVTCACVYLWRRSRTQAAEESARTHGPPPAKKQPVGKDRTDEKVVTSTTQEVEESKTTLQQAREVKAKGNGFFKEKKFEEAIACYEQAIELCPEDHPEDMAMFNHNIAACYENMAVSEGDSLQKRALWMKVEERCTRAITLNKVYIKAFHRRARARMAMEKYRDALLDVTRVLLLDETQGRNFADMMPNLLKSLGKKLASENYPKLPPLEPPNQLVKSFVDSFIWKDDLSKQRLWSLWETAHPTQSLPSDQASSAQPDQSETGKDQSETGKDQSDNKAQSDDEKEAKVDETTESRPKEESDGRSPEPTESSPKPDSPVVNGYHDMEREEDGVPASSSSEDLFKKEPFVVAAAQFRRGMYVGVLDLLTEALSTGDPVFHPHAYLLHGTMCVMWRMDGKALKDFQAVLDTKGLPQSMYADALVKRAVVFASSGREEECEAEFNKAVEMKKDHADIYLQRGRLLLDGEDIEQFQRSVTDLELALKLMPNCAQALYCLGSVYVRIGAITQSLSSLSDAKKYFDEAYQKHPDYVEGLIVYAMFLQDTQNFSEARNILHKVLKLEPDNASAHFSLSMAYIVDGSDIDKASKSLETAIAMDSSCVHAYEALASVELQRGNMARAMELYETALKNVRSFTEMQQAYVTREMFAAQDIVCRELNIDPVELASRRLAEVQQMQSM